MNNVKRKAQESPGTSRTPPKRNLSLIFENPKWTSLDIIGYITHVGEAITTSESGKNTSTSKYKYQMKISNQLVHNVITAEKGGVYEQNL